jgi:CRP-like cAMP-binding protein
MFVIESGRVRVQTRKEGHRRAARDDITRRSIDEDFDFDMSDDIVATAMMNKEESSELDAAPRGKRRGIFACCFGGGGDDDDESFSRLAQRSGSSLNVVIAERGAGDVIGEMSLLSEEPTVRSASVKAVTDVTVSVITKDDLDEYFKKSPEMLEELRLGLEQRRTELLVGATQSRMGLYTGPLSPSTSGTLREKLSGSRNNSQLFDTRSSIDSADGAPKIPNTSLDDTLLPNDLERPGFQRPETR